MSTKEKSRSVAVGPPMGCRGASRDADEEERRYLVPISEEGAMTRSQLGRLVGAEPEEVERMVARLAEAGWLWCRSVPGWRDPWIWLRSGGYRRAGTGYRVKEVRTGQLAHRHAIVEARLLLGEEFPGARWISERELWRSRREGVVPDGLLIDGVSVIAVEAEISSKPLRAIERMMAARCRVFGRVIYFCMPVVATRLRAVKEALGAAQVEVRELGSFGVAAPTVRQDRRSFEPDELELRALRLICEEGLVAAGQLGPLLELGVAEGIALAVRLEERNFVRRSFEAGDGGWLHVTKRAARLSGTGLEAFRPFGAASLADRLVLARIRMGWCASAGERGWRTRRVLLAGLKGPRRSDVPMAVAEADGRRYAVVLAPVHVGGVRLGRDLALFAGLFDGVLCFADPAALDWVRGLAGACPTGGVEVLPMPTVA